MAIAFDAFTDGTSSTGANFTWNHTCTGTKLLLTVNVLGDLSADLVTSVTFNASSMIKQGAVQIPSDRFQSVWTQLNPASGSHQIKCSASSSIFIGGVSASYTGVNTVEKSATGT